MGSMTSTELSVCYTDFLNEFNGNGHSGHQAYCIMRARKETLFISRLQVQCIQPRKVVKRDIALFMAQHLPTPQVSPLACLIQWKRLENGIDFRRGINTHLSLTASCHL